MALQFTATATVPVGSASGQDAREYRIEHESSDSSTTTYTIAQLMDELRLVQHNGNANVNNLHQFYLQSADGVTNPNWDIQFTASTNVLSNIYTVADGPFGDLDDANEFNNATDKDRSVWYFEVRVGTGSSFTTHRFYAFGHALTASDITGDVGGSVYISVDLDNCFNSDGSAFNSDAFGNTDLDNSNFVNGYRLFRAAFIIDEVNNEADTEEWRISSTTNAASFPVPALINCNFRLTDNTVGHKKITVGRFDHSNLGSNIVPSGTLSFGDTRLQLFGGTTTQTGAGVSNVTPRSNSAVNIGRVRFGGLVGSLEVEYEHRAGYSNWAIRPYDLQNSQGDSSRNIAHGQRMYSIIGGWPGTVTMPDIGCTVYKEVYPDNANGANAISRYDIDVLPQITGTATIGVYKPVPTGSSGSNNWTTNRSFAHSGGAIVLGSGTTFSGINPTANVNYMELRPLLGGGSATPAATIDPDLGTTLYVWPDSYWDVESKPEEAASASVANQAVFNVLFPDADASQSGTQDTSNTHYLIRNYPFNAYGTNRLGQSADPANQSALDALTTSNTNATPVIFSNITASDPESFRQITIGSSVLGLHLYNTFYTPRFEDQVGTRYTGGFIARQRLANNNLLEAATATQGTPTGLYSNTSYTGSPRDWVNIEQPFYLFEYAPDDSKNGYQLTWGCRLPRYGADDIGGAGATGETVLSPGGFNTWLGVPGIPTVRRTKVPFDSANNTLDLNRTDIIIGSRVGYWDELRQRSHYESFTEIVNAYAELPKLQTTTPSVAAFATETTYAVNTFVYNNDGQSAGTLNEPGIVIQAITDPASTLTFDQQVAAGRIFLIRAQYVVVPPAGSTAVPLTFSVPFTGGTTIDPDANYELVVMNTAGDTELVRATVPAYYITITGTDSRNRRADFAVANAFVKSGSFANIGTTGIINIDYNRFSFEIAARIQVYDDSSESGHTWSNEMFRHYTTMGGTISNNAWEPVDDFIGGIEFLPLKMAKAWGRRTDAQKTTEIDDWMGSSGYVEKLSRVHGTDRIGYSPTTFDSIARTAEIHPTSVTSITLGTPSDTATDRANVAEANVVASSTIIGSTLNATSFTGAFDFGGIIIPQIVRLGAASRLVANDASAAVENPIIQQLGTASEGRLFIYFDPVPAGEAIRSWAYFAISGYVTNTGTDNILNVSLLQEVGGTTLSFGVEWNASTTYGPLAIVRRNNLWYQNLSSGNFSGSAQQPGTAGTWSRIVPKFQVTPINDDATFTTPSGLNETVTLDALDVRFTGTAGSAGRIPNQTSNITTLVSNSGAFDLSSTLLDCAHATNPHVQLRGNVTGVYAFDTAPSATQFSVNGLELAGDITIANSSSQSADQYVRFTNCTVRPGATVRLLLENNPLTHEVLVSGLPAGVTLVRNTAHTRGPTLQRTVTINWNAPGSGGHARISVVNDVGHELYGQNADSSGTVVLGAGESNGNFFQGTNTTAYNFVISGNGVADTVVRATPTGDAFVVNMSNALNTVFTASETPTGVQFLMSESTAFGTYSLTGSTSQVSTEYTSLENYDPATGNTGQGTTPRYGFQATAGVFVIGVEGATNGTYLATEQLIAAAFGSTVSTFRQILGSRDYNRLLGYRRAQGDTSFGYVQNIGNRHIQIDARYVRFAPGQDSTQHCGYLTRTTASQSATTPAGVTRDRGVADQPFPFRVIFDSVLPSGITPEELDEVVRRAKNQIIANL